jgi:hypothetical protein
MQIFVYFSSTCFGLYTHLQEQIEFLLQMRHMVPLLQLGVLRSVRVGGKIFNHLPTHLKYVAKEIQVFKLALKRFLLSNSFYSNEEYFDSNN